MTRKTNQTPPVVLTADIQMEIALYYDLIDLNCLAVHLITKFPSLADKSVGAIMFEAAAAAPFLALSEARS